MALKHSAAICTVGDMRTELSGRVFEVKKVKVTAFIKRPMAKLYWHMKYHTVTRNKIKFWLVIIIPIFDRNVPRRNLILVF